MVSGRPIKIFGIYLFCIMHIANKEYQWQNNETVNTPKVRCPSCGISGDINSCNC